MRKKIDLPSGIGTVTVRKMSGFDAALTVGELPVLFAESAGRESDAQKRKKIESGIALSMVSLTKCCSPITTKTGARLRIVEDTQDIDRLPDDCITVGELDTEDARSIINAVSELTNMGKEDADKAKPFYQEQSNDGVASHRGEMLREDPIRVAEVAA